MKWLDDLKARLKPKNTAEREKMKKYLVVFPLMFISCIASIWLIFASGEDDGKTNGGANTELPDGSTEGIEGNKIAAYEAQAHLEETEQRNAQAVQLEAVTDSITAPQDTISNEVQSSAEAYQGCVRLLPITRLCSPRGKGYGTKRHQGGSRHGEGTRQR